jgi:anti-sigma factor RsiW
MTQSTGPRQWDCPQARIALGVYVLGVIDPAEQALVDEHLDGCDACQAEMAELADLPALLALVSAEDAVQAMEAEGFASAEETAVETPGTTPGLTVVRAPQRAPASEDRRGSGEPRGPEAKREGLAGAAGRADRNPRKRGVRGVGVYPPGKRRWLAVAAAAAVIGAASFGGVKLAAGPAGADPHDAFGAPAGAWQTGYGSVGGVTGTVAYRSMGWGTQLAAKVAGLPLNTPCQLWIVEGNGTRVQAGSWDTDANEGAVWYPGSAQVAATAIKSFVITVKGGRPVAIS